MCPAFDFPCLGFGPVRPLFHINGGLGLGSLQPRAQYGGRITAGGLEGLSGLLSGLCDHLPGAFLRGFENLLRPIFGFEQSL